jgi:soluble lytic murein transglycosylase-like protein
MPSWIAIIPMCTLGAGLFLSFAVPNVITPTYNNLKGDYEVIEQWMPSIERYAVRYGVDPSFVAAVMYSESSGRPDAVSPQNAIGLMQIMPNTARGECGIYNPAYLLDPEINIACGVRYIAILYFRHADGDYRYVAAMYIGGPKFNPLASDAHGTTPLEYADRVMQHYRNISEVLVASR